MGNDRQEIERLEERMTEDFNKAPYTDKIRARESTYKGTKSQEFVYTFEDKTTIIFNIAEDGQSMSVGHTSFTTGVKILQAKGFMVFKIKFTLKSFLDRTVPRGSRKKYQYDYRKDDWKKSDIGTPKSTSTHPRRPTFDLLKRTLAGYEAQLRRERQEGRDTRGTENEITNVKRRIQDMRDRYTFEGKGHKSPLEKVAILMKNVSEELGRHGCNDVPEWVYRDWSHEERKRLAEDYAHYNGAPSDYYDDPEWVNLPDFCLWGFLSHCLRELGGGREIRDGFKRLSLAADLLHSYWTGSASGVTLKSDFPMIRVLLEEIRRRYPEGGTDFGFFESVKFPLTELIKVAQQLVKIEARYREDQVRTRQILRHLDGWSPEEEQRFVQDASGTEVDVTRVGSLTASKIASQLSRDVRELDAGQEIQDGYKRLDLAEKILRDWSKHKEADIVREESRRRYPEGGYDFGFFDTRIVEGFDTFSSQN